MIFTGQVKKKNPRCIIVKHFFYYYTTQDLLEKAKKALIMNPLVNLYEARQAFVQITPDPENTSRSKCVKHHGLWDSNPGQTGAYHIWKMRAIYH